MRSRISILALLAILSGTLEAQDVYTRSGYSLELSGLILINGFTNSANTFIDDVPLWVRPALPPDSFPSSNGSASVRQSRIILTVSVPDVGHAAFTGEVDVDFFGGQVPSSGGRTFPLLRIRRVVGHLQWPNFSILFGQEAPPIAEINPSSLAAIGVPGFAAAGNLWLWIPQVRVRGEFGSWFRLGLEGAALAPTAGTVQNFIYTEPDRAERSRRPYLQGRVIASWGDPDTGGEVSFGGHYGWIATTGDSLLISKAGAAAARFFVTQYVEIRGEAFVGEALRGLGSGGILQNFGAGGVPLRTKGGWGQLNFLPTGQLEIGGGAGIDDPNDADFAPGSGRLKNLSYEGHLIWRPSPIILGVEYRRHETTWGTAGVGKQINNHFNIAAGFEF